MHHGMGGWRVVEVDPDSSHERVLLGGADEWAARGSANGYPPDRQERLYLVAPDGRRQKFLSGQQGRIPDQTEESW